MNKLAMACELSLNDWLATFPDIIPEAERSKKHEKWKKNLFNKMRDDYYHRFTTKTVKIMLVAAVFFALLLTAFVIPSSREFMLNIYDTHSTFKLTENNKNSVNGEITVGYIPEGYKLESDGEIGKSLLSRYENENEDYFTIFKHSSSVEVDFNTEDSFSEEIMISNVKYIYCAGNLGMNTIVWIKNDYVYQIDSLFNKEELLKIAKTVE